MFVRWLMDWWGALSYLPPLGNVFTNIVWNGRGRPSLPFWDGRWIVEGWDGLRVTTKYLFRHSDQTLIQGIMGRGELEVVGRIARLVFVPNVTNASSEEDVCTKSKISSGKQSTALRFFCDLFCYWYSWDRDEMRQLRPTSPNPHIYLPWWLIVNYF